ncbi:hypothetical protein GCM10025760_25170 [Microbacterium yannicii]|uniref:DUF3893 domain-containing protein n=1 Tax=Microbacterium yannicii TaxID=671622 RepID=A0ABP9MEI6_9MICO|nr:hypothetical protein [Microbacterium yannicii]MCO5952897.1 hypothetical protein [Microbacterium yannicii]
MTRVEVLTPLRLETRFQADGAGGWILRLRAYPDDVALARPPAAPLGEELDILEDALAAIDPAADPAPAADAAFRSVAASLGGRRAWWLWRTATTVEAGPNGMPRRVADRSAQAAARTAEVRTPLGLPEALDVWLVLDGGTRLADTLAVDRAQIAAELGFGPLEPHDRTLPRLWWLDYERARDVGLATELALTQSEVDTLRALVVVGAGDTPAADLLASHAAAGRLGVVAQGTPTNTVAGRDAAPLADDPETWLPLLDVDGTEQPGTVDVLRAFGADTGAGTPMLPLPGGESGHGRAAALAVRGLWPVLWGRTIRDVVGTIAGSTAEPDLAEWAARTLAVQGPWPAVRVGDQPYGLLPTSDFGDADLPGPGDLDVRWQDAPGDDPMASDVERSLVQWAVPWRDGAARAAAAATTVPDASPVVGADSATLLALHGRHAPSMFWRVRRVDDLPTVQAQQIAQGLVVSHATGYDRSTARAWHGSPFAFSALTAAGARRHLPGPPRDEEPDPDRLFEMLDEHPEPLYFGEHVEFGLLGHLLREALIIARATVGRAALDLDAGITPDPGRRIPLDDDYPNTVMRGSDDAIGFVAGSGREGELIVRRFDAVREALKELIEEYRNNPADTLRGIKAALDAASFRADPWLMGMAARRAGLMANAGAPFLLGAYGWVDRPQPWSPARPGLPPGPTEAGLLHAPSFAQAQVAAVLRDAAVRTRDEGRWDLTLTADKVRAAIRLNERVRLGVHPFEALGLEVEAVAGDPNDVRMLRRAFPTTGETAGTDDVTRRVCDGAAVLDAVRANKLPPGLPADLGDRLAPLDDVLDAYADLLLVDGVHALVTRSPEAGGAAMEAAAGLATPVELLGIRTPREATTVPVSCWLVLPAGQPAAPGADPVAVADPVFHALAGDAIDDLADPVVSGALRLLGGSEAAPDGMDDHPAIVPAMMQSLKDRRAQLLARAETLRAALTDEVDVVTDATVTDLAERWKLELHEVTEDWTAGDRRAEAAAAFAARIDETDDEPASIPALQDQLRTLVGRRHLPVVPVVDRGLLPPWVAVADGRLDAEWLEIVAAVRPRVAALEAHQLTAAQPWPAAIDAPAAEPWSRTGPVRIAYGPEVAGASARVGLALLDRWVDSVPSQHHVTQAAFGFNAPKTRAPNAVLVAVPPDPDRPLEGEALLRVVMQVRRLALARAARPTDREGLPWATPSPIVQADPPVDIRQGWPT